MLKNFIELVYDPKPTHTDPFLPMDVAFLERTAVLKFFETIQPSSNDILLDIGGSPFNWYRRGGLVKRVDTLNLTLQPMDLMPDEH